MQQQWNEETFNDLVQQQRREESLWVSRRELQELQRRLRQVEEELAWLKRQREAETTGS